MIKEKALAYYQAGFNVLPTNTKKIPTVEGWKDYQENRQSADLVQSWTYPCLAIIGGFANVECFDIDTKNDLTGLVYEHFLQEVKKKIPDFFASVVIQRTPSGGWHWIYKIDKIEPNQVLAANDQKRAILETRGKGGYFLVSPSPGYELVQGSFENMPIVKSGIRSTLFLIAKKFDMRVKTTTNNTKAAIERQISKLEKNRIDITGSYADWIKIGFGLQSEFGENGRDLYHRISQLYTGYDSAKTDEQYNNCLKDTGIFKSKINAVFGILKDYGVVNNRTNFSQNASTIDLELIQPSENRTDENAPSPVPKESSDKSNRYLIKHQAILDYLEKKDLRYNEITHHIEKPGGENLSDWCVNSYTIDILRQTGSNVGVDTLNRYIWSDTVERYNPITSYFDKLPKENTGELGKLLSTISVKDENMNVFIQKWLCSIVAAAYGNVPELVLVLIGAQGSGKNIFFERLLPEKLRGYCAVDNLSEGKDSDILMTQKLIILDDEFYGKSKKDAEHFKSITSRKVFSIRKPYGRIAEDLPRLAVLCGASNKTNIINDNTGNRRIIPVEITGRDFPAYDKIDRDKLFSQLLYYYEKLGENSFTLNDDERTYLDSINDDYQLVNSERELLLSYIKPVTREEFLAMTIGERESKGFDFRAATSIGNHIQMQTGFRIDNRKLGQELNQAGFEKDKRRVKGAQYPIVGYYVQMLTRPNLEEYDHKNDIPF